MASKRSTKPASGELIPKQPVRGIGQQPVAQTPPGYGEFLEDLKSRIRTAQIKASLSVNRELIQLYWSIGRDIAQRQQQEGWGKAIVERLAKDLQDDFPGLEGFSARNIWHARAFYMAYAGEGEELKQAVSESDASRFLPQPVPEIPWGHNIVLLQKLKDTRQRLWYAQQTPWMGSSKH